MSVAEILFCVMGLAAAFYIAWGIAWAFLNLSRYP